MSDPTLKKIMKHADIFNKKLNKTYKNNAAYSKCDKFCKDDFVPKSQEFWKRLAKTVKQPYKPFKKSMKNFLFNGCKKSHCNPKCTEYDVYLTKKQHLQMKKELTNDFHKNYTKSEIKNLKERGALTGCIKSPYYHAVK
jgi:hypothetical protein